MARYQSVHSAGPYSYELPHLNEVRVNSAERTVWAGSGAEWQAVTAAAAKHDLAVQAGAGSDVGITGFLLSGGISWLSRSRGLAVNDVLRFQVVGADGKHESLIMIMSRMSSGPSAAVEVSSAW
jgi:FAD/FMN-containing dehydrogenase